LAHITLLKNHNLGQISHNNHPTEPNQQTSNSKPTIPGFSTSDVYNQLWIPKNTWTNLSRSGIVAIHIPITERNGKYIQWKGSRTSRLEKLAGKERWTVWNQGLQTRPQVTCTHLVAMAGLLHGKRLSQLGLCLKLHHPLWTASHPHHLRLPTILPRPLPASRCFRIHPHPIHAWPTFVGLATRRLRNVTFSSKSSSAQILPIPWLLICTSSRHSKLHSRPVVCPVSECGHRTAKSRDMDRHVVSIIPATDPPLQARQRYAISRIDTVLIPES
jgi:hypothetical protein